jgi:hypothetical protein
MSNTWIGELQRVSSHRIEMNSAQRTYTQKLNKWIFGAIVVRGIKVSVIEEGISIPQECHAQNHIKETTEVCTVERLKLIKLIVVVK